MRKIAGERSASEWRGCASGAQVSPRLPAPDETDDFTTGEGNWRGTGDTVAARRHISELRHCCRPESNRATSALAVLYRSNRYLHHRRTAHAGRSRIPAWAGQNCRGTCETASALPLSYGHFGPAGVEPATRSIGARHHRQKKGKNTLREQATLRPRPEFHPSGREALYR